MTILVISASANAVHPTVKASTAMAATVRLLGTNPVRWVIAMSPWKRLITVPARVRLDTSEE